MVRTPLFQGEDTGSIPVRDKKKSFFLYRVQKRCKKKTFLSFKFFLVCKLCIPVFCRIGPEGEAPSRKKEKKFSFEKERRKKSSLGENGKHDRLKICSF